MITVEAGTIEQYEIVERIQLLLNEELPDFVQQHIVLVLLLASHVCRAKDTDQALMTLDNMFGAVAKLVEKWEQQQPGETRQ